MESLQDAGVTETDTPCENLASFNIQRIGGQPPFTVSLPLVSSLRDLKHAIATAVSLGPLAFRLITEDSSVLMGSFDTKLAELGLVDGATLTMITDSARDYSRIIVPDKVIHGLPYPNGILIDKDGKLYVTHYYGDLMVYNSKYEAVGHAQIYPHPRQMTLSPSGELVVAFGDGVRVFDRETLKELRHFPIGSTTGIAVHGGLVYTSHENMIRVHQFKDGTPVGAHPRSLKFPQGLAIVDGRMLAVADRDHNRILLLEIDTLEVVSELPPEGAPQGQCLNQPNDVIADSAGNLLVMDTGHERIAVFREDGTFVASVLQGFFKDHCNTFSYLSYNQITGAIAVSNNDEHCVTVFSPIFTTESAVSAEDEAEVKSLAE